MADVHPAGTWPLFKAYVSVRLRSQHQYRLSFYLRMVAATATAALDFIVILVIFEQLPTLGGWSLWEVAFLYGTSFLPFKLADLFVGNVERLSEYIKSGAFDSVLIRPVSPLKLLILSDVELTRIGGAVQGLFVLILALTKASIDWDVLRVLEVPVMVASGFVIYCCIWVMGHATAFWLTEMREVFNSFTYGGSFMAQFPLDIFAGWMKRLFAFVIPVAFVNYFPASFILGKADTFGLPPFAQLLSPLVAIGMLGLTHLVWKMGLRHYRSTGS